MSTAVSPTVRLAVCAGAWVAANVAFFVLSGSYHASHHGPADALMHNRIAFASSAFVVAAVSFTVGFNARTLGHGLAALLGLGNFIAGLGALVRGLPPVIVTVLLIAGVLMPVLAWFSYHRSRVAWAFLGAICGVFAVVNIFGAPRQRDALGVSLWTLMLVPALYVVAAVTLYILRDDYSTTEPRQA